MVKPGLAECVIHNHTYPHKLCENVFLPALLDNIICEMKQPSNQAGQVILMVLPLVVSLFSHRVAFSNTKLEVFFDNKIPSCCLPPAPFCPPICSDAFTERNRGNRGQDSSPILEMEKLRSTYDCRDWKRFYNYFRKNRPHRKEASIIFFNHWSYYNPIQAQVVNNCSGFPFNILVKVQKKKRNVVRVVNVFCSFQCWRFQMGTLMSLILFLIFSTYISTDGHQNTVIFALVKRKAL